jgi:hypothetical protein
MTSMECDYHSIYEDGGERLQLVEQHVIGKHDPRYSVIDHVAPERGDAKKRTG